MSESGQVVKLVTEGNVIPEIVQSVNTYIMIDAIMSIVFFVALIILSLKWMKNIARKKEDDTFTEENIIDFFGQFMPHCLIGISAIVITCGVQTIIQVVLSPEATAITHLLTKLSL